MNISSQQFKEAYDRLPPTIRGFLAGDELVTITEEIGNKYGLHVDTIGALNREATNMLLGITNPAQFVGELKSVGIPETNIGPIVQELNERVFMPLQEKMKRGDIPDTSITDEEIMREVAENIGLSKGQDSAIPADPPLSVPTPIFVPPVIQPTPQVVTAAAPQPPTPDQQSIQPQTSRPQMPPMQTQPTPRPTVATTSVPPPAPSQAIPSVARPTSPPVQSENRDALHQVLKEYGIDPYREPPE